MRKKDREYFDGWDNLLNGWRVYRNLHWIYPAILKRRRRKDRKGLVSLPYGMPF